MDGFCARVEMEQTTEKRGGEGRGGGLGTRGHGVP